MSVKAARKTLVKLTPDAVDVKKVKKRFGM